MLIPYLLQQGPLDELLSNLGKLLPLVIFIGAAMLPALKHARDKKRKQEAAERSALGGPPDEDKKEAKTSPSQLEERVRRFFHDVSAEQQPKAAPPPPLPPLRASPPKKVSRLVEIDHLDVNLKSLDVHLQGLPRSKREVLPSRMKGRRAHGHGKERRTALRTSAGPSLRSLLRLRRSQRQAIVLREILGPPKGLED
ncbi:MAG: hypothetical protein V2A76_16615 [Planctomycetota bacterium]